MLFLLQLACTTAVLPDDGVTPPPPTELPAQPDPFAPLEPRGSTLTDISTDLEAVLEHGALEGACAAYAQTPDDEAAKLLCGKAMFFYEDFDGAGVPTAVFDFLTANFPDQVGPGHREFGLIEDPYDPLDRPLGFPQALPLPGGSPTVAFGCAACHFGRLPDGRYAVGMPNLDYDYGGHMLAISLAPTSLTPGFDPQDHDADAIHRVQPLLDELNDRPVVKIQFGLNLLSLLGEEAPQMSRTSEAYYAGWAPGTLDFVIDPLPLNDDVHIVSRIPPLWEMPEGDALLAWTGGAGNLTQFLQGFIAVTGSVDAWPPERLEPLHAYLLTLRAPVNPDAPSDTEAGRAVFDQACLECHGGPRGAGTELYAFDEIGTDDALMRWGDPDLTGSFCCGMAQGDEGVPTHAVKSPRLTGLWTQSLLLHNGSLTSLEALVCLEDRAGAPSPYSDAGHTYGCELPEADREALVRFLRSI